MLFMTDFVADYTMDMSGSSKTMDRLDEGAATALTMFIRSDSFSTVSYGLFGLLTAWGIKRNKAFAWSLGLLLALLMLAFGLFIAVDEMVWAGWCTICPSAMLYMIGGSVALVAVLAVRKDLT
jgi:hypothetical protein